MNVSPKRREAMLRRWAPVLERSRRIDREMLDLHESGRSLREIGAMYGVSGARAGQRVKRARAAR